MTISFGTALLLGLLVGLRHALEPDHLAAVSTLITRSGSPRAGALLGACWGLGHAVTLLAICGVLAGLDSRLPPSLAGVFELLVAGMLLALGARALVRAARDAAVPVGARPHKWMLARRPLLVGMVHGLAGSGALSALVLASLPTPAARLGYVALVGLGSLAGMAFLTGVAGWPLAKLNAGGQAQRWLTAVTGVVSLVVGAGWGWTALRGFLAG